VRINPIERESYSILEARVDLSHLSPRCRSVVARVIHATADLDYATSMVLDDASVSAGVEAVRAGAPVVVDVQMVAAGLTGVSAECHLPETGRPTRAAAGMAAAAACHPAGALVVVGCAPSALLKAVELAEHGVWQPALVVGLPVGFVGAAAAKERLRASGLPSISNVGDKGGSAAAAAVVNALAQLASKVQHA